MISIKEKKVFEFVFPIEKDEYRFNITTESEEQAKIKLHEVLSLILTELNRS